MHEKNDSSVDRNHLRKVYNPWRGLGVSERASSRPENISDDMISATCWKHNPSLGDLL
jgi:hypothetical protein